MSTSARKFTSTSDAIAIAPATCIASAFRMAVSFAFQFDAGATSTYGIIFAQYDFGDNANSTCFLNYNIGAPNTLAFGVKNGGSYNQWTSSIDPFSDMAGDGLWHTLVLEWAEYNSAHTNLDGYSLLTIDGVQYTTQWTQTALDGAVAPLGSSTLPITFGSSVAGPAIVGLSIADIGIWNITNPAFFDYSIYPIIFTNSGTYSDIANFGNDYDAQVIEPQWQADVLPITGASPETGYKNVLTGTITGTSVVAGPPLWPPVAVTPTFSHGAQAHTPGSSR